MYVSKRLLTLAIASLVVFPTVSTQAATPTTTPTINAGFSPEGSAALLVLDVINNAKHSLRMLSYVMTSQEVVSALIKAKQRGVNILVVADYNVNQSREKSQECLKALLRAGIPVRVTDAYRSLHDKVIIAVQTGSFNYAYSAFGLNSENVVVIKDVPEITKQFMNLWRSRWYGAKPYSIDDHSMLERHL